MTHTENLLSDLKKENLFAVVLNLENKQEKFMETFCECLNNLCNTVGNLSRKLEQVESSLVVTKTVNDNLLNRITLLDKISRNSIAEENVMKLLAFNLQVMTKIFSRLTVCNISNESDVLVVQKILRIVTGSMVTVLLSYLMQKKIVGCSTEKERVKNTDGIKFNFNTEVKLYINESFCPYHSE